MKILLVEDDVFFQKFYSKKLTDAGFELYAASDGEEGLAYMRKSPPDLVLLDLVMPKKDGFDVLTEKGADPALKAIPVLVFSTLGQEADIERARSLGAHDYVNKTFFDFDNLLAKIRSYLPKNPA